MINRKLLTIALTIFSTIFLCGSLFGQTASQQDDIADISNNGSNVSWSIRVPYESATLTVSTPSGEVFRQVFKAGAPIAFSPNNTRGLSYGSGRFNFEIVLSPILSSDVKSIMAQSRIDGNSDLVMEDLRKRGIIPAPMKSSGTFAFENGNLITAGEAEKEVESLGRLNDTKVEPNVEPKNPTNNAGDIPPENVQVIIDDLVVIGSECVGQDCVSGENFGFDTLRLKENNLRLHFDDTSNSASFPFNDWRIVANDTSNGGASYLGFEDATAGRIPFRVEAGAPSNALVVEDSGHIGFGTINPVVELHVVDGDSPTLRLEQDGSSGFTAQTWDVAGNEANFFVRDVTNGSNLPFRIKPGASSGSININTGGNVGIGFNSSSGNFSTNPLEVRNNGSEVLAIVNTSGQLDLPKTGGGIRFPDGTIQTTATSGTGFGETNTGSNVGSGGVGVFSSKSGTVLQFRNITAGANVSVTQSGENIEIASATVPPLGPTYATSIFGGSGFVTSSSAAPTLNANSFSMSTASGFAVVNYNFPTNPNLADPTGTNVTFKIRYRDSDGAAAGSSVTVSLVKINVAGGNRTVSTIFSSSNATTTEQTVTVCQPANLFDFSGLANHLNVALVGNAEIVFVQVYKGLSCP